MSFNKLKELRSVFRDHKDNLWRKSGTGDITRTTASRSNSMYEDITKALKQTADDAGHLEQFTAANTVSKEINRFNGDLVPQLAKVAVDKSVAAKFVKKMVDSSGTITESNLQKLGGGSARAIRAKELQDVAISSMDKAGTFNMSTFFNQLNKKPSVLSAVRGTKEGKMLDGLMKVMNDYNKRGSIDLGPSAKFGPHWALGSGMLDRLSATSSKALKRNLIRYGLIDKNQALKEYLGNQVTEKFIRMGTIFTTNSEGTNVIDLQQQKPKKNNSNQTKQNVAPKKKSNNINSGY
jgi:hypothetical protein